MASLTLATSCYHRKANIALVPVPVQVDSDRIEGRGVPLVGPRWHRVEPGMNKDDVLHYVGEPTRRSYENGPGESQSKTASGDTETWFYDSYDVHDGHFDPHRVAFKHGRVVLVLYDQARFYEKLKEESVAERNKILAAVVPPDVGFACDVNEQCQSKKCLEHKCAGPHDCTRAVGDPCLTNTDCCSGRCDAGATVCR
ncbi:MAG: hypothetical protein HY075_09380 [Deltaproteobacteria bacterium]|nr:hypothetical protein [Deltaproteobacteria bacterium]